MKVTDNATFRLMQTNLDRVSNKLLDLRYQGATGLKFNKASDAPGSIRPVLTTRTQMSRTDRYLETMGVSLDKMQATDGHMASVENIMQRAKELALSAINSSLSSADRQTIADEIAELKNQLLDSANATIDGKYIFSGFKENTIPFVENPDYDPALYDENNVNTWPYLYQGDANPTMLEITPGEYVSVNITGNELFMGVTNELAASGYNPPYLGETVTATLNPATAPGPLDLTIGDAPLVSYVIPADTDANYAANVANVINSNPTGLTATVNAATTDLGPLNLAGYNGGDTYSLSVDVAGSPINVTLDGATYDYTLQGLANALGNTVGAIAVTTTGGTLANGVTYDISSGSLVLTGPTTGEEISLTETIFDPDSSTSGGISGGNQTVYGTVDIATNTRENVTIDGAGLTALGLTPTTLDGHSGRIDIFSILTRTEEAVRAGNFDDPTGPGGSIQSQVDNLETAANQNRRVRSRLGARAGRVETAISSQEGVKVDLEQILSRYQDADVIETFNNIVKQETAFQAALNVTAKISQISILDYF
ncbi:flagellar hook-associated protein FlgL [Desulfopila aestuarii]|uniref:Flagellar hook-associated protein 3 n=1 Tax=Desulfopila aestuarii DSM 18488 TaxID=1121416 RepID=A0A1M7YE44_9BACT|nr:flagellar hook-associated protein FlgL [Desulfopila aestuarii]SHO50768.1 flagellar hook-associated protein 3 [Desulfopila aestuarii DSM 18488]